MWKRLWTEYCFPSITENLQITIIPFDLTSGKHIIAAKASDILGNMSEPVYLTIIVDGGTPEVQIVPTR